MPKTFHFIMQPKGGTGKSVLASYLYQFLDEKGHKVIGFDTDNVNFSFCYWKDMDIHKIKIAQDIQKTQEPITFAPAIDTMLNAPDGTHAIIDNGSATAPHLEHYLKNNNIMDALIEQGFNVIIHVVVASSQYRPCLNFLNRVPELYPGIPICIWVNSHRNNFLSMAHKQFHECPECQNNMGSIMGIVEIPEIDSTGPLPEIFPRMLIEHARFRSILGNTLIKEEYRHALEEYWNSIKNNIEMACVA